jgi:uncharacterized Zn-binding protein involved in type VI secretion
MSRGLARFGDRTFGTCTHPSHLSPISIGGTIVGGSGTVTSNNISNARLGDQVITDCGHLDVIINGSPTVTANNIGVARLGDQTGGLGTYFATIITASPTATTP